MSHHYYASQDGARRDHLTLPPIRNVVGDELRSHPAPPHHRSPSSAYDVRDLHQALPPMHERRERHPPAHGGPPASMRHAEPYSRSGYPSHDPRPVSRRDELPNASHSYQTFYNRPGGALVNIATSSRPQGITRRSDLPPDEQDARKRHICHECGRRFDRPSGLESHLTRHSGVQPFQCNYCGQSFNVKSNMTRHIRNKHQPGADPRDDYYSDDEPHHSSPASSSSSTYYAPRHR